MKLTWNDLQVNFDHIDPKQLTESWSWLIGTDKKPILMSSIGDLFLTDKNNAFYWLNVGEGTFEKVADNIDQFKAKLKDAEQIDEWFLIGLVEELKESGH